MAAERPEPATFPYFSSSPSFGRESVEYDEKSCDGPDSPTFGGAHRVVPPPPPRVKSAAGGNEEDCDASSDDFEFSVELKGAAGFTAVDADEIFSGGRILPMYPVFNRDLIRGPAESKESAKADPISIRKFLMEEKEAAEEEPAPHPPARCKKSASTGALRSLLRTLTIGRSHSYGKEKFVFIEASRPESASASAKKKAPNKGAKKGPRTAEGDVVTANPPLFGRGASDKAVKGPRRSFLPYRQELLGLFAPVNSFAHNTNKRNPFYY